ncbi:MAG TPA: SDR family oxidoreductase [Telluria sp.]|jgi:nucleoside-diphosphate-sugar epimerase
MRIFVTGATGFVGSAIVTDLLRAGHQVTGLARSSQGADTLTAAGAAVHRGDLDDVASLQSGTVNADAVVHAAFDHDFSRFALTCEVDRRAIDVLGEALAGSGRPLVVTAGLPVTPGRPATEDDVAPAGSPRMSEQAALAWTERDVRVSVVRMAQVHDQHKQGFATYLLALAREKCVSAYVGDGMNRWPAVRRIEAAALYRLALERGTAGACYHAVTEEGIPVRQVAEAIGRRLGLPAVSLAPQEAAAHFGFLARPAAMDVPASSTLTRQRLGWRPAAAPGFVADIGALA